MASSDNIADMRVNYTLHALDESMVANNPMQQFKEWFDEAVKSEIPEPNIMVLSTVNRESKPTSRVVLLKDITETGLTFYTNYLSHKSSDMESNPNVSLVFLWIELQRQVRIEGTVTKLSEQESVAYFNTRPVESRLGAIVSQQSEVIQNREVLDHAYQNLFEAYQNGKEINKPVHWGGYLVNPNRFEFWQGRASRLHDRIFYQLLDKNVWKTGRLSP